MLLKVNCFVNIFVQNTNTFLLYLFIQKEVCLQGCNGKDVIDIGYTYIYFVFFFYCIYAYGVGIRNGKCGSPLLFDAIWLSNKI